MTNELTPKRYYSLDVFRGATVALMILVNNPGSWEHIFSPLQHAPWHGCTPTDLVFPFFLFAVGNAMVFVIPRLQKQGDNIFWKKVIKRSILIFLIGLGLNWFPFVTWQENALVFKEWISDSDPTKGIRIMGVLQRIAIVYLFASIISYYFRPKTVVKISIAILLIYWIACILLGGNNPYSLENWFGTSIDVAILGEAHVYKGEGIPFDPEGLVSSFPAISQVLLGYLIGLYIQSNANVDWIWKNVPKSSEPHFKLISSLMVSGFLLLIAGMVYALEFPLNKKIWSSSYVIYTTGLAVLILGTFIWYIEVLHKKNFLTKFFDVFGKNPLFIFVLSGLLPRALGLIRISTEKPNEFISPLQWYYLNICSNFSDNAKLNSLIYAISFILFMWLICYVLDKKRIYIKV